MPLSFNGVTKIITITTDTELDVKDLWSRWVDWWVTSDNSKYELAMEQLGGNDVDIVAGTSIPIYIYLLNDWKIKPKEASHTLSVTNGILLSSDSSDPFIDPSGSYTVRIRYQQPVQAITTTTESTLTPSAQEIRDSMKLSPTAGTPAAGSVDEELDKIRTNTGLIPGLF